MTHEWWVTFPWERCLTYLVFSFYGVKQFWLRRQGLRAPEKWPIVCHLWVTFIIIKWVTCVCALIFETLSYGLFHDFHTGFSFALVSLLILSAFLVFIVLVLLVLLILLSLVLWPLILSFLLLDFAHGSLCGSLVSSIFVVFYGGHGRVNRLQRITLNLQMLLESSDFRSTSQGSRYVLEFLRFWRGPQNQFRV